MAPPSWLDVSSSERSWDDYGSPPAAAERTRQPRSDAQRRGSATSRDRPHHETGRNAPSKSDLIVLVARLYGADEATLTELEELRGEASKRGWWSTYRLPKWLAGYVG